MSKKMIFHQLFEKESSTYSYLIADEKTGEAALIDPVWETKDRDLNLVKELGLTLKYILETHVHADHITGSNFLKDKTQALVGISAEFKMECPDLKLKDKDVLKLGELEILVIETPGHTSGCLTYFCEGKLFTGDALLVRGCGRTDFQEGSSNKLFKSVREKLFKFPDETFIYPAHDYKGFTHSRIKEEKMYNPRLNLAISESEFVEIMQNLNLSFPKKINEALPINLKCGQKVQRA